MVDVVALGIRLNKGRFNVQVLARLFLHLAVVFALILSSQATSFADVDDDSSADAPGRFTEVISKSKGVIIRVPQNPSGAENTNAAEMRFYQKTSPVTKSSNPLKLWADAIPAGSSDAVMGRNMPQDHDSSTWGWWNWYGLGWVYPNYYVYYYPTFYWGGWWYHYNYFWNWRFGGWNYYYYTWWY
jgi:hypothetical protein